MSQLRDEARADIAQMERDTRPNHHCTEADRFTIVILTSEVHTDAGVFRTKTWCCGPTADEAVATWKTKHPHMAKSLISTEEPTPPRVRKLDPEVRATRFSRSAR